MRPIASLSLSWKVLFRCVFSGTIVFSKLLPQFSFRTFALQDKPVRITKEEGKWSLLLTLTTRTYTGGGAVLGMWKSWKALILSVFLFTCWIVRETFSLKQFQTKRSPLKMERGHLFVCLFLIYCDKTTVFFLTGINMFWAQLRVILGRAAKRGLEWLWKGPKHIYAQEYKLYY